MAKPRRACRYDPLTLRPLAIAALVVLGLMANAGPVGSNQLVGKPSNPAVVRGNTWFVRDTNTTGPADSWFSYGDPGDLPLFGDWDSSDTDGPGVVRDAVWYLRNANNEGVADVPPFVYGNPGDVPISGRWTPPALIGGTMPSTNIDHSESAGVVRGNTWLLRNSNTTGVADISFIYGDAGDVPIVGDWNGDGVDTPGVVRGNTWLLRNSNSAGVADVVFAYGNNGDLPIVGDWDGNMTDTPGIVRLNVRYLRNSNATGVADVAPFAYGDAHDEHMVWTGGGG